MISEYSFPADCQTCPVWERFETNGGLNEDRMHPYLDITAGVCPGVAGAIIDREGVKTIEDAAAEIYPDVPTEYVLGAANVAANRLLLGAALQFLSDVGDLAHGARTCARDHVSSNPLAIERAYETEREIIVGNVLDAIARVTRKFQSALARQRESGTPIARPQRPML